MTETSNQSTTHEPPMRSSLTPAAELVLQALVDAVRMDKLTSQRQQEVANILVETIKANRAAENPRTPS